MLGDYFRPYSVFILIIVLVCHFNPRRSSFLFGCKINNQGHRCVHPPVSLLQKFHPDHVYFLVVVTRLLLYTFVSYSVFSFVCLRKIRLINRCPEAGGVGEQGQTGSSVVHVDGDIWQYALVESSKVDLDEVTRVLTRPDTKGFLNAIDEDEESATYRRSTSGRQRISCVVTDWCTCPDNYQHRQHTNDTSRKGLVRSHNSRNTTYVRHWSYTVPRLV